MGWAERLDVTILTESVDHGDRNRSLLTALKVTDHPTQEQRYGGPDTGSSETDERVPDSGLFHYGGDNERGGSEDTGGKDVPRLLVGSIGVPTHGQGNGQGDDVDGDGHDCEVAASA